MGSWLTPSKLSQLFSARLGGDGVRHNEVVRRAHSGHGYSLSKIGQAVGWHYSTISRIVNSWNMEDAQFKILYLGGVVHEKHRM